MTRLISIPKNERICARCGANSTYTRKNGKQDWYKVDEQPWCKKCHFHVFQSPKYNPEKHKKFNPTRIRFKDKRLLHTNNPRKGYCQLCSLKVGDEYINCRGKKVFVKKTDIHHIQYHDSNYLKDTIELCPSCHMKETWKQRRGC